MKKKLFLIALIGCTLTACRPTNRHVVIADGNDDWDLRIEYFGNALFNNDTTAIAAISKNGLIKYRHYGRTLVAENGTNGKIIYRIDGGESQTELAAADKKFVAKVVKELAGRGFNNDGKWQNN